MSYTESVTNWDEDTVYSFQEQNRVESNIKALKDEAVTINGDKVNTGNNTHSGENEFTGAVSINEDVNLNNKDINNCGSLRGRASPAVIEVSGSLNGSGTASSAFNALAAYIPNSGNDMLIHGMYRLAAGLLVSVSRAVRTTAQIITLYGFASNGVALNLQIYNALGTSMTYDLSW